MNCELFITAIKNEKYISIDEFSPGDGVSCNCTCPKCGEYVRSNVTSKGESELKRNFTNHFSHINTESKCQGGYKETELHLFAKKVIEKNNSLKVPGQQYHYPDTIKYASVVLEKAFPIEKYKQFRPDIVIITWEGEKIVIEIIVTNPLSLKKTQLFIETQFKCLTINLSGYQKNEINSLKSEIENHIIEEYKESKKWIWPPLIQDIDTFGEIKVAGNPKTESSDSVGCLLFLGSITVLSLVLLFA